MALIDPQQDLLEAKPLVDPPLGRNLRLPVAFSLAEAYVIGHPGQVFDNLDDARTLAQELADAQETEVTTAVQDRSVIDKDSLADWLKLAEVPDEALFDMVVEASKELADSYMNNPFEDPDGVELAIPNAVEVGVLRMAQSLLGGDGTEAPKEAGVIRVKTGDLEVGYAVTLLEEQIPREVRSLWNRFRLTPGT